ncbi:MAG: hypothetical protein EA342_05200 [Leptolyngbya sp. LCM1.Bin17]|nr:MAG: hypothetical protein EA342_05200 [Leptolyngbya sp. LCM1.Bin17]
MASPPRPGAADGGGHKPPGRDPVAVPLTLLAPTPTVGLGRGRADRLELAVRLMGRSRRPDSALAIALLGLQPAH